MAEVEWSRLRAVRRELLAERAALGEEIEDFEAQLERAASRGPHDEAEAEAAEMQARLDRIQHRIQALEAMRATFHADCARAASAATARG